MIENDFSKGNVCRHILMQAVPLTIAQLIQLLYNVVDRIYIGHLPGTQGEALTGVRRRNSGDDPGYGRRRLV